MSTYNFYDEMELVPELERLLYNKLEPGRKSKTTCFTPLFSKRDPTTLNLSPISSFTYAGGSVNILGDSFDITGSVFYPSKMSGTKKPFNDLVTNNQPTSIIFLVHGNHFTYYNLHGNETCDTGLGFRPIPSYTGYDYLQKILARMGFIAVSVNCHQTNCAGSDPHTNITIRSLLVLESIRYFQSLHAGSDPIFSKRIDFSRVGLLGHSRGAEAVLLTPELLARGGTGISGVTIKSVISLAPTDYNTLQNQSKDFAFMTILPAGDGDVITNDGARFYDKAIPSPFKCQLYIHHTNHNFFNNKWPVNDSLGPAVMSRAEHEKILCVYSCAFFRQFLMGHPFLQFLTGKEILRHIKTKNIHISFEIYRLFTVDDHENGNISLNALGKPTTQTGGLTAGEYFFARSATGAPNNSFNNSFFGNTIGMVAKTTSPAGLFRSALVSLTDLTNKEILIRAAEVYTGSIPAYPTGFKIGLEDSKGNISFVDSDDVGSLPRPYDRKADDLAATGDDFTKTMLKTLRFPTSCFAKSLIKLDLKQIKSVILKLDRNDQRAIAFDQLQVLA